MWNGNGYTTVPQITTLYSHVEQKSIPRPQSLVDELQQQKITLCSTPMSQEQDCSTGSPNPKQYYSLHLVYIIKDKAQSRSHMTSIMMSGAFRDLIITVKACGVEEAQQRDKYNRCH